MNKSLLCDELHINIKLASKQLLLNITNRLQFKSGSLLSNFENTWPNGREKITNTGLCKMMFKLHIHDYFQNVRQILCIGLL